MSNLASMPGEIIKINIATIEDLGLISRTHLRDDGYTEEQIDEIRKAYDKPRECAA